MKRFLLLCSAPLLAAVSAYGQAPAISAGGVVPAATYAPSGLVNSGIAQGSFFSIFGSNLGPTTPVYPSTSLYPTTLGGTSVTFTVAGKATLAYLYFVSAGQVNGVLPSATTPGPATVTVTTSGGSMKEGEPATVVKSNFGTFTRNGGGTGPAIAQSFPSYSLNALNATAKPGDTLILYGTGLGPNPGGDQVADTGGTTGLATDLRTADSLDFHLYVGGVDATSGVGYAGLSGFTGLDQINLTLPNNVPSGCYVPVAVRIGTIISNFPSISISASGGTCSDPYGLTSTQIDKAVSGDLSVASLLLTRIGLKAAVQGLTVNITEDNADGRFYKFDGTTYADSPSNIPAIIGLSSFGSCAITSCANTSTCIPTSIAASLPGLDAGSALSVAGNAQTGSVPKTTTGIYAGNLASFPVILTGYPVVGNFLAPGTFSFTGPGGADISAFNASITVPAALTPTYSPTLDLTHPLNRSQDLTVSWNASGLTGYVLVSVTSATNANTTPSMQTNSATITCLPQASAGSFTVPSYLLQALPVSSTVIFSGLTAPGGAVLIGSFNLGGTFSSNADVSLANALVLSGQNVNVQ